MGNTVIQSEIALDLWSAGNWVLAYTRTVSSLTLPSQGGASVPAHGARGQVGSLAQEYSGWGTCENGADR